MQIVGLIFGLVTAWGHSVAYVLTRAYTVGGHGSPLQLLVRSHALIGVIAALTLPGVVWWAGERLPGPGVIWLLPVLAAAGFATGQCCMFGALRHTEASRAAPPLSLKIPLLAVVTSFVLGPPLQARQWAAVGLAVAATAVLGGAGGRLPRAAVVRLAGAVVAYATTDTLITRFLDQLKRPGDGPADAFMIALAGFACIYTIAGLAAAVGLIRFGSRDLRAWRACLPYTATWIVTTTALYAAFATLGVVFANIVQSSRTLWSVVLGMILARAGVTAVEARTTGRVALQRLAAAALLFAAIVLFAWPADPATPAEPAPPPAEPPRAVQTDPKPD